MKTTKDYFQLFLIILIFMLLNFLAIFYLNEIYLILISIVVLTGILAIVIHKKFIIGEFDKVVEYVNHVDLMDFSKDKDLPISINVQESLEKLSRDMKENLKAQVEISTDLFHICEKLNAVSQESLAFTETIAASVETADLNTVEQSNMLNKSSELTNQVFSSLKSIEGEMIDKIESISNSINMAQNGIENVKYIEERIRQSSDMTQKLSKEILQLKDYSDEIVGLIDLINSISKETNMLSLNASIEAARAGEHGKGFGVVAMEVGKLAKETEEVSVKIEEIIYSLINGVDLIVKNMEKDMEYQDANCSIISETNEEFANIVEELNIGKNSLEDIKEATEKNNKTIEEVNANINKVASFSEEIATHMEETTAQVLEQHNRSQYLQDVVEEITENVYKMQQFVAGKVMEEKMFNAVYYIKDYVKNKGTINEEDVKKLLKETGMDDIYITDSQGIVKYTSNREAIGLDLYEADKSFLSLKEGKKEYIVTPIKIRVEDGALFKFLVVIDENKQLYEVGMALDSLLKI